MFLLKLKASYEISLLCCKHSVLIFNFTAHLRMITLHLISNTLRNLFENACINKYIAWDFFFLLKKLNLYGLQKPSML